MGCSPTTDTLCTAVVHAMDKLDYSLPFVKSWAVLIASFYVVPGRRQVPTCVVVQQPYYAIHAGIPADRVAGVEEQHCALGSLQPANSIMCCMSWLCARYYA